MQLIVENVHKSFGENHVLRGASQTFPQGHIYALLGRNGAGKTTLFDLIAGKKNPDEGTVWLETDGVKRPLKQKDFFYMVANPLLPHFLTGREFAHFISFITMQSGIEGFAVAPVFIAAALIYSALALWAVFHFAPDRFQVRT